MGKPMPTVFLVHGNPMNALQRNSYTEGWAAIGRDMPRPRAILCVSAHWYIPELAVTATPSPPTIHDFGGFPRELYEITYPAPGAPELARQVQQLLAPTPVHLDHDRGLDHGTWAVLCHAFPEADIPVVQLSIDRSEPAWFHYQIGRLLSPLRDEGVLVAGSGNLVHNLHAYAWGGQAVEPYDWSVRFERRARELLVAGDDAVLVDYESLGSDATRSVPTPDHFLPLLHVTGARRAGEQCSFPVEGVDGGSVSMLTVCVG